MAYSRTTRRGVFRRAWRYAAKSRTRKWVFGVAFSQIAGLVSGVATLAGVLTGIGALAGTAAGVATVSGALTGTGALAGSTDAVSTVSGTLTATGALAGSTDGVGTVSGTLVGSGALAGSSDGVLTVSGTMAADGALAAATNGVLTVSGVLISLPSDIAGSADGVLTVSGALVGSGALAGSADGVLTVSGALLGSGALAGSTDGVATLSGTLAGSGALAGASSCVLTVGGDLQEASSDALVGAVSGVSTVSGTLTATGALSGASTCEAACSGVLSGTGSCAGSVAGVCTCSASGRALLNGTGSADGALSVSGVLSGAGALSGGCAAECSVSGTLQGSGALAGLVECVLTCSLDVGNQGLGVLQANGNIVRARFAGTVAGPLSLPTQYDNAPPPASPWPPSAAPWCRFEVDLGELEMRSTGGGNIFRKRGEFRAQLRAPIEAGDGALLGTADAVVAAFRMATDQGVNFGVPRVTRRGRQGGWWLVEVSGPFWDDVNVAPLDSTSGTITGSEDVSSIIRTRFRDLVATPETLPTAYENAPFATPDAEPWAMVTILPGEQDIAELGTVKTYRMPGVVMVRLHVPLEDGDAELRRLADVVLVNFRAVRDRGVLFRTPSASAGTREGAWWTANVECPFVAELRAS